MTKKVKIVLDKERADMLADELSKLQAWHSGWHEAGKMPIPGSQAVWQVKQLLRQAKETK